jgi:hypothetical protein
LLAYADSAPRFDWTPFEEQICHDFLDRRAAVRRPDMEFETHRVMRIGLQPIEVTCSIATPSEFQLDEVDADIATPEVWHPTSFGLHELVSTCAADCVSAGCERDDASQVITEDFGDSATMDEGGCTGSKRGSSGSTGVEEA